MPNYSFDFTVSVRIIADGLPAAYARLNQGMELFASGDWATQACLEEGDPEGDSGNLPEPVEVPEDRLQGVIMAYLTRRGARREERAAASAASAASAAAVDAETLDELADKLRRGVIVDGDVRDAVEGTGRRVAFEREGAQ